MNEQVGKKIQDVEGQPVVPNVLIVEDDDTTRVILKMFLSKIGFDVGNLFEADNGLKGLKLLEQEEINLIVTDINMPVMDGLEMLEHLGEHPDLSAIPSIVVSSERDSGLINSIISNGHGFVPKPFTINAIEHEILNLESLKYGNYIQA